MERPRRARVRRLRSEDIPELLQIKKSVRQLCGETSLDMLHSLDPQGFLVAVTEKGDVCGGCCIAVLSDSVAMVGFWGVQPELLESFLADELLRGALRRVRDRNVVLRSDRCTIRDLERTGLFPHVGPWLFHKAGPALPRLETLPEKLDGVRIKNYNADVHADRVGWYATDVLKMRMHEYLLAVAKQPDLLFKVAFEGDAMCGMGTIERDVGGCVLIRHLFASGVRHAQLLVRSLLADFSARDGAAAAGGVCMVATGRRFRPNGATAGQEEPGFFFYESFGLSYVSSMRMAFTQRVPAIDYNRLFALYVTCSAVVMVWICSMFCGRLCISERAYACVLTMRLHRLV